MLYYTGKAIYLFMYNLLYDWLAVFLTHSPSDTETIATQLETNNILQYILNVIICSCCDLTSRGSLEQFVKMPLFIHMHSHAKTLRGASLICFLFFFFFFLFVDLGLEFFLPIWEKWKQRDHTDKKVGVEQLCKLTITIARNIMYININCALQ